MEDFLLLMVQTIAGGTAIVIFATVGAQLINAIKEYFND